MYEGLGAVVGGAVGGVLVCIATLIDWRTR